MDPLFLGSAFIDFEEPLDLTAPLQCLAPVTAAHMAGFKLRSTNGGTLGNFEHGYAGVKHPRDLPHAHRSQIYRFVSFAWRPGHRTVLGNQMRIEQFLAEFKCDAAFRRHFEAKEKWDGNLAIMDAKIKALLDVFGVKAGYDDRRTLLIPMRGGDEKLKRELLRLYEG